MNDHDTTEIESTTTSPIHGTDDDGNNSSHDKNHHTGTATTTSYDNSSDIQRVISNDSLPSDLINPTFQNLVEALSPKKPLHHHQNNIFIDSDNSNLNHNHNNLLSTPSNRSSSILETMISTEEKAWREEEERFRLHYSPGERKRLFGLGGGGDGEDEDDDDSIQREWKRLSDAEKSLREELELSNLGFNFMVGSGSAEVNDDDASYDTDTENLLSESSGNLTFDQESVDYDNINKDDDDDCDIDNTNENSHYSTIEVNDMDHQIESNEFKPIINSVAMEKSHQYHPLKQNQNNFDGKNNITTSTTTHTTSHDIQLPQPISTSTTSPTLLKQISPQPSPTSMVYTIYDHSKFVGLRFDNIDLGHPTCPMIDHKDAEILLDTPSFHSSSSTNHPIHQEENDNITTTTTEDDQQSMLIQSTSSSPSMDIVSREKAIREIMNTFREYVKPMTRSALSQIYEGLVDQVVKKNSKRYEIQKMISLNSDDEDFILGVGGGGGEDLRHEETANDNPTTSSSKANKHTNNKDQNENNEILPVRTIMIRIRPDVLCGAVMDAVYTSVQACGGEMTKRQGGHLRALISDHWIPHEHYIPFRPDDMSHMNHSMVSLFTSPAKTASVNSLHGKSSMSLLPSFVLDAQVVTRRKSRDVERILLIRFYRVNDWQIIEDGSVVCSPTSAEKQNYADVSESLTGGTMLRESAALLQRLRLMTIIGGTFDFDRNDENLSNNKNEVGNRTVTMNPVDDSYLCTPVPQPRRKVGLSAPSPPRSIRNKRTPSNSIANDMSNQPVSMSAADDNFLWTSAAEVSHPEPNLSNPLRTVKRVNAPSKPLKTPVRKEKIEKDNMEKKSTTRRKKTPKVSMSVRFGKSQEPILKNQESAQKLASEKLFAQFKPTPSVQDEFYSKDAIPSLSLDDWPFVQSCWRFIKSCMNELDNRDLAYSTLISCPFGKFPSLPTLDVQYCSQMKTLSRDNMILALVRSAQELEQYAKESELSCTTLLSSLQQTYDSYQITPSGLPEQIPLSAYPLDYQSHFATCPPWGQKVMEALNLVAKKYAEAQDMTISKEHSDSLEGGRVMSEFEKASDATCLVLSSFQKQEDEELSARLSRKNVQVMDRLAKLQAYKRELVVIIRAAYGSNTIASKAADQFHSYAEKYVFSCQSTNGIPLSFHPASDQVPLLTCRVFIGSSTGTCYVTCNEILFVTQRIPLLGGNQIHLFSIKDIELGVNQPTKSIINLPQSVSLYHGHDDENKRNEIFSFRPSVGANSLKDFIDILKEINSESAEMIEFSTHNSLLNMYDKQKSIAKAALGTKSPS